MKKIKIILDSTGDLPLNWIEKLDVGNIPLHVLWEDSNTAEDDIRDFESIKKYWDRLDYSESLPKTSQPTPMEFKILFQNCFSEGYEQIFVICLSSAMSGTFNSAEIAAREFENKVAVFDSKMASAANALIARRARELAEAGKDVFEIKEIITRERFAHRFGAYFYVSNFNFLVKGGRVSKFAGFVGNLLNLRVSIFIDDAGNMIPFGKSRGSKKAQKNLIAELEKLIPEGESIVLTMVNSDNLEESKELAELLRKKYDVKEIEFTPMGKVISSHVGPGTAGFGVEWLRNF